VKSLPDGSIRKEVLEIEAYAVEEPEGLIKLDANENPYALPPELMETAAERCRSLKLNRYPDPGAAGLRGLLGGRIGWDPAGLMLGNGSDELISILCTACGHAGARMQVPAPTFAMYRIIGSVSGWVVDEVPLDDDFGLDGEAFLEKIRQAGPRLVVLATPNNPTGNSFDGDVVRSVVAEAPGLVVVDEAYFDFCGKTFLPLLEKHRNLLILRTLSKIGLAAIRLGILVGHPEVVMEFNKVRLPYNISAFSQEVASLVLEDPSYLDEEIRTIVGERELLMEEMGRMEGLRTYRSDANFILFRTVGNSAEIFRRVRDKGVLIRDLGRPGPLLNCLRVTVGTPEENRSFLDALRSSLA
jgi:histidinol-phosphate aminotransferase